VLCGVARVEHTLRVSLSMPGPIAPLAPHGRCAEGDGGPRIAVGAAAAAGAGAAGPSGSAAPSAGAAPPAGQPHLEVRPCARHAGACTGACTRAPQAGESALREWALPGLLAPGRGLCTALPGIGAKARCSAAAVHRRPTRRGGLPGWVLTASVLRSARAAHGARHGRGSRCAP